MDVPQAVLGISALATENDRPGSLAVQSRNHRVRPGEAQWKSLASEETLVDLEAS